MPGGDSEGEGGSVCDMPEGEGGLGRGKGQPEQRIRRHRGGWAPAKPWLPPDRHPNEIAKGTIYGSSLIDGRWVSGSDIRNHVCYRIARKFAGGI